MAAMELGLAHSLSQYKLKFSPDKIDTMIVQVSETSLIVGYPKVCSVSFFYYYRQFLFWMILTRS